MVDLWTSEIGRIKLDQLRATVETEGWKVFEWLVENDLYSTLQACVLDDEKMHKSYQGQHDKLHQVLDLKNAVGEALAQFGENEKDGVDSP